MDNKKPIKGFTADSIPHPPDMSAKMPWAAKDSRAKSEVDEWDVLLEEKSKKNDITWLAAYGWVVLIMTIIFTAIFALSLIVWSLHYLLPEKCLWLTAEQLSKMQSVLFSGGMGAIISTIIKNQLDKTKRQ